jgi:hypothetical protein
LRLFSFRFSPFPSLRAEDMMSAIEKLSNDPLNVVVRELS